MVIINLINQGTNQSQNSKQRAFVKLIKTDKIFKKCLLAPAINLEFIENDGVLVNEGMRLKINNATNLWLKISTYISDLLNLLENQLVTTGLINWKLSWVTHELIKLDQAWVIKFVYQVDEHLNPYRFETNFMIKVDEIAKWRQPEMIAINLTNLLFTYEKIVKTTNYWLEKLAIDWWEYEHHLEVKTVIDNQGNHQFKLIIVDKDRSIIERFDVQGDLNYQMGRLISFLNDGYYCNR